MLTQNSCNPAFVLKGRGEPVEKDWKLKRSDTGDPTAFPANFSDHSDNALYMERCEGRERLSSTFHRDMGGPTAYGKMPQAFSARCRSLTCCGYGAHSPMLFPAAVPSAEGRARNEREPTAQTFTVPPEEMFPPPDRKVLIFTVQFYAKKREHVHKKKLHLSQSAAG